MHPMVLEEVTAPGPLVRTFGLVVCCLLIASCAGAPGSIPGQAKECYNYLPQLTLVKPLPSLHS